MDAQDWAYLADTFKADICAGIGLIGNEDEERELVRKCVAMDEEELEKAEIDVKDDVPDELGDVSMEGIEEDDKEDSEEDEADDKEYIKEDDKEGGDMNDAEMGAVDSKPDDEVSFHPYKPAKRHRDGNSPSKEELGDYETLDFGNGYVEANGNHIHVMDYFGSEWVKFIVRVLSQHHSINNSYQPTITGSSLQHSPSRLPGKYESHTPRLSIERSRAD